MSFAALVLAGARGGHDPLAAHAGVPDKALIDIHGVTMLERVVAALREAGAAPVYVSASGDGVAAAARALGAIPLAAAPGPSESVAAGLAAAGAPLLVTTADHALLRPAWIADFRAHVPPGADVAALLAERGAVMRDAPPTRRTWLRFADGDWSGANMFWLATPRAAAAIALWRQVEQDRKRPWRIVRRLGPWLLLRYALRRLTLAEALAALGRRAGIVAAVVAATDGRAAIDVDTPADLALVRGMLAADAGA